MAGCGDPGGTPCSGIGYCSPPHALHRDVQLRAMALVDAYREQPAADVPRGKAALSSLLAGRSVYTMGGAPAALAPYQRDRVSLPVLIGTVPTITDLLAGGDRAQLEEGEERFLRNASDLRTLHEERGAVRPYTDPRLSTNRRALFVFLRVLLGRRLLGFSRVPRARIGTFFVWKKGREKMRLILDAREASRIFRDPPGVQLLSAEGLASFQVESSGVPAVGLPDSLASLMLHFQTADVDNCFHRLRLPAWLRPFFCWPSVTLRELGVAAADADLCGPLADLDEPLFPTAISLPMGFSWSLCWAQRCGEWVRSQVASLRGSTTMQDNCRPFVVRLDADAYHDLFQYLYVDNLGVLGRSADGVAGAMSEWSSALDALHLQVHEKETHGSVAAVLGLLLDTEHGETCLTPKRYWVLHDALVAILARPKIDGLTLRVVVGHCTFCGLLVRATLSTFFACYAFIERHLAERVPWWPTARDEITAFLGLLPGLRAQWTRSWNQLVLASDASEDGYAVASSLWPLRDVKAVSRQLEKRRFKFEGSISAREAALTAAGFVRSFDDPAWRPGPESMPPGVVENGLFPEVPARLLDQSLWRVPLARRFWWSEGIVLLESRALLSAMRRVACSRFGHYTNQLFLVDNMGMCLGFARCRSSDFKMLSIIRHFYAYALARGITAWIRWIPSELNPSDEGSRLFSKDQSKSLTSCIPSIRSLELTGSAEARRVPAAAAAPADAGAAALDHPAIPVPFDAVDFPAPEGDQSADLLPDAPGDQEWDVPGGVIALGATPGPRTDSTAPWVPTPTDVQFPLLQQRYQQQQQQEQLTAHASEPQTLAASVSQLQTRHNEIVSQLQTRRVSAQRERAEMRRLASELDVSGSEEPAKAASDRRDFGGSAVRDAQRRRTGRCQ